MPSKKPTKTSPKSTTPEEPKTPETVQPRRLLDEPVPTPPPRPGKIAGGGTGHDGRPAKLPESIHLASLQERNRRLEEEINAPKPPPQEPLEKRARKAVPKTIEAATVIFFEGLWFDVVLRIEDNKIVDKLVGPGDMKGIAIERAVASVVAYGERQRIDWNQPKGEQN